MDFYVAICPDGHQTKTSGAIALSQTPEELDQGGWQPRAIPELLTGPGNELMMSFEVPDCSRAIIVGSIGQCLSRMGLPSMYQRHVVMILDGLPILPGKTTDLSFSIP